MIFYVLHVPSLGGRVSPWPQVHSTRPRRQFPNRTQNTTATMFRQDQFKKAPVARKHFGNPAGHLKTDYPHRLNFYSSPPTAEVTLDQFEQWAIDRLRGR